MLVDVVDDVGLVEGERVELLLRELKVGNGLHAFGNEGRRVRFEALEAQLGAGLHVHDVLPCVVAQIADAEGRVLEAQLVRRLAFGQLLLHEHAVLIELLLIHDADGTVVDLRGDHGVVVAVEVGEQHFDVGRAREDDDFARAHFGVVGDADGLIAVRADEGLADDVVLGIGDDRLTLPPIEGAVELGALAVCKEVILRLLEGDLVDEALLHPAVDELRGFLEAVVEHRVSDFAVDDDAVVGVVVEAEHAVEVALIALPVVVDEGHRALVVLPVAVHVVVEEVGEKALHLRRGETDAVLDVLCGETRDCARFDGLERPVLVEEQKVGIL